MKKLIVFDLDGTIAESKSSLDAEMSVLLHDLLGIVKVAVISGGDWPQFEKQLLSTLPHDERLVNLSVLPTCGTKFYKYAGDWKKIYSEDFTVDEKNKIISSLKKALEAAGFKAEKVWGQTIEDRGSQITFSALGQQAPIEEKKKWDPDFTKRKKIKALLDKLIPEFSVRLGGTTSVDITKPGIDKAYGIRKLRDILGIPLKEMIFVGDALFPAWKYKKWICVRNTSSLTNNTGTADSTLFCSLAFAIKSSLVPASSGYAAHPKSNLILSTKFWSAR
jgi:HAD superfamily hydrolase (TIGR01484 family)